MLHSSANRGFAAIILAFFIWGGFPAYWRLLGSIDSLELLYIRLILTAMTCLALMPLRGSWPAFKAAWRDRRVLGMCLIAALLMSCNWFCFIWAVTSGNILESSLGYFLCPLVTVLLGRFVEKEPMGIFHWLALGLAMGGVATLIMVAGRVPIAALIIAVTWGSYGLIKKRSKLGPVVGLGMETVLVSPLAAIGLAIMAGGEHLTVVNASSQTVGILILAGVTTAAPLLLFAYAVPRIRMTTMGMGQYSVPSMQFCLAILYGEIVTGPVLAGFGLIWIGLAIYALSPRLNESR